LLVTVPVPVPASVTVRVTPVPVPVPVRVAICVCGVVSPGIVNVTVNVPVKLPLVPGANATFTVQLAPSVPTAVRVAGQLLVCVKFALAAMVWIVTVCEPVFCITTGSGVLVVPTA
jgi:hypothetical protein